MRSVTYALTFALLVFSNVAMADKCLNTEKGKYADNDRRNADYVECPSNQPANTYGAVGAIGKLLGKYISDDTPKPTEKVEADASEKKEKGSFFNKFWPKEKTEPVEKEPIPADSKKE